VATPPYPGGFTGFGILVLAVTGAFALCTGIYLTVIVLRNRRQNRSWPDILDRRAKLMHGLLALSLSAVLYSRPSAYLYQLARYTVLVYTIYTMKNITLSAPEELIEAARRQAEQRGTTLNQEFRDWLASRTTTGQQRAAAYRQLMEDLSYIDLGGRKFTREEMNER
jgi:hypothetical protein